MKAGPWAEERLSQKIIMTFASLGFVALLVIPALDRRFGWSHLPPASPWPATRSSCSAATRLSRVPREQLHLGAIELAADQRVISTGPYARCAIRCMRRAGDDGGIPIALGSGWGLLALAAIMSALSGASSTRRNSSPPVCLATKPIAGRCRIG